MPAPPTTHAQKTTEVGRRTRIPVYTLHNYIRQGFIAPPARDGSGHFLWFEDDIARALEAWELRRPLRRDGSAA